MVLWRGTSLESGILVGTTFSVLENPALGGLWGLGWHFCRHHRWHFSRHHGFLVGTRWNFSRHHGFLVGTTGATEQEGRQVWIRLDHRTVGKSSILGRRLSGLDILPRSVGPLRAVAGTDVLQMRRRRSPSHARPKELVPRSKCCQWHGGTHRSLARFSPFRPIGSAHGGPCRWQMRLCRGHRRCR